MNKKKIIILSIVFLYFVFWGSILSLFLLWYKTTGKDQELKSIGIGMDFEYDYKDKIKDYYTWTGKLDKLYFYHYSEDKETELINRIKNYGHWEKISKMKETDFYFSFDIKPISEGYIYYYNCDYFNEVYEKYDYYLNEELGGTISQFFIIAVIDTENNCIWYFETQRIKVTEGSLSVTIVSN